MVALWWYPLAVLSLPSRERGLKLARSAGLGQVVQVAPLAGAWIEILYGIRCYFFQSLSLPSRERGLKCLLALRILFLAPSLPSRERGLKLKRPTDT